MKQTPRAATAEIPTIASPGPAMRTAAAISTPAAMSMRASRRARVTARLLGTELRTAFITASLRAFAKPLLTA